MAQWPAHQNHDAVVPSPCPALTTCWICFWSSQDQFLGFVLSSWITKIEFNTLHQQFTWLYSISLMQRTKSGECPHDALTIDEFWHLTWMTVNALYKTIYFYNITWDKMSATRLWNHLEDMTNESNFKKHLLKRCLRVIPCCGRYIQILKLTFQTPI